MTQSSTRDITADLLKGTAVVLMIQVHILELFARQEVMDGDAGRVALFFGGPPVAPVFLALLGFYALRSARSPRRMIARGVTLLAVGGLLNLGLNLHLLVRIQFGLDLRLRALDPREYLLGVDILVLAGVSLMLITLLRAVLKDRPLPWALAAVGVAAAAPWMTDLLTLESVWKWPAAFVAGHYRWSYFPLFPWLAYPLLGVAVFNLRERLRLSRRSGAIGLAVGLPILLLGGPFALATSHDLPAYYHHGLGFFLWTGLFLAVWTGLHARIAMWPAATTNALAWLGRNVTACYVVQWLLIGNLATAFYKSQSLLDCIGWFVAIFCATIGMVHFQRLIRRPADGPG